jgi:hypothetical protein
MAFNHLMLPGYQVANGFDVSPISNALDSNRENALAQNRLGLQQRQLGLAERADARQGEAHAADMEQRKRQQAGALAQMGLAEKDPVRRANIHKRMISLHGDPSSLTPEYMNPDTAFALVAREAEGFRSQDAEAKLGLTRAQTAQAYAQADRARRENIETGLVPQYMVGEDGVVRPFVMNKRGEPVPVQLPQGMRALGPGGMAEQKEVGKLRGGAIVNLDAVQTNADLLRKQIKGIREHPRLSAATGIGAYVPTVRSDTVDLEERIKQLQGGVFLQAYESLKGAGQITEVEGEKAEKAKARIQNLKQSDAGYLQALQDFEDEVQNLVRLAERKAQAGRPPAAGGRGPAAPAGGVRLKYNPATGELE